MKMKRLIPAILALGMLTVGCGQTNQEAMNEVEEKSTPVKVEQVSKDKFLIPLHMGVKSIPSNRLPLQAKL